MVTHTPDNRRTSSAPLKPLAAAVTSAILLAAISSQANAQQSLYLGAAGLASMLDPDTNDTTYEVTDDSSGGYKGMLGVDLTDWLGLEVNLGDLGASTLSGPRDGEIEYKSWNLSSLLYWPGISSGLRPFIKAGIGDVEVTSTNGIEYTEEDGPVATGGLGLEYLFNHGLSLRGEFDYLDKDAQTASLGLIKRFFITPPAAPVTDSDNDGVADSLDHCAGTPAGTAVLNNGCPPKAAAIADADGDNVADEYDRCPGTPANVMVMANGCPPDSDGDGVYDNADNCPATPAGTEVGLDGCSRPQPVMIPEPVVPQPVIIPEPVLITEPVNTFSDSDLDGIPDSNDRCPSSQAGTPVDQYGCAEFHLASGVLDGVNFHTASVLLTEPAKLKLNEAANALLNDLSVRVLIIGHTDNVGGAEANRALSYDRAKAVASYLAMRGVEPSRIRYVGKGEQTPIATNDTADGRAQNRRVEIVVGR